MAYGGDPGCSGVQWAWKAYSFCSLESERTVHSSSVSNYLIFFLTVLWSFTPTLLEGPVGRLVPRLRSEQAVLYVSVNACYF